MSSSSFKAAGQMDDKTPPLLEIDAVTIQVNTRRGSRTLFTDLSLVLRAGASAVIMGPSGVGKTTLFRAVIRMAPLERGSIRHLGREIGEWQPHHLRRSIGLFQQKSVFFPGTVEQNLLAPFQFKAASHAGGPDRAKLAGYLEDFHLSTGLLDEPAESLSEGEGQRVALIRLLLIGPRVLLLDEPTANLDEESAELITHRIADWVEREQGGVLWIAHTRNIAGMLGAPVFQLEAGSGLVQQSDAGSRA